MLCLIGGVDRGLRMGGRCVSKLSLKHGTLLGVPKEGSTSAKVLWDDSDAIIRLVNIITIISNGPRARRCRELNAEKE